MDVPQANQDGSLNAGGSPWSLPGVSAADAQLLHQAHAVNEVPTLDACSVDAMRDVSHRLGIELATAILLDRVACSPVHAPFINQIEAIRKSLVSRRAKIAARLVIVPGAYYKEYPEIGGDGRILRAVADRLGCPMELIPTASVGGLQKNARLINSVIRASREKNVILLSLSKGSADVKAALALPDAAEAFAHVKAWVDLCGITHGTPLTARLENSRLLTLITRLIFWLRGHDFQFARDLTTRAGGPLDRWPHMPEHLRIIHVAGFPLPQHLSAPLLQRNYRRLIHLGPNDGCGLLAHAREWPGLIYPLWGVDHYLRPAWDICTLTEAILLYLGDECGLAEG